MKMGRMGAGKSTAEVQRAEFSTPEAAGCNVDRGLIFRCVHFESAKGWRGHIGKDLNGWWAERRDQRDEAGKGRGKCH